MLSFEASISSGDWAVSSIGSAYGLRKATEKEGRGKGGDQAKRPNHSTTLNGDQNVGKRLGREMVDDANSP